VTSQAPDDHDGPPASAPGTVTEPARFLRLATMAQQVLDELHRDGMADDVRERLGVIYDTTVRELGEVLSDDLRQELQRLAQPVLDEPEPSESELRLASAQLAGWISGLFQALQASAMVQAGQPRPESTPGSG
jgi:hypothetical protein